MAEEKEAKAKSFREVETWKKAHQWVLEIYKLAERGVSQTRDVWSDFAVAAGGGFGSGETTIVRRFFCLLSTPRR